MSHSRQLDYRFGQKVRGLRLKAGAIPTLFGIPAASVANRITPLADLPSSLAKRISAGALQADKADEQVGTVGRLVGEACSQSRDSRISSAIRRLSSEPVGTMARQLGVSERQLYRLVLEHVGVSPSRLKRIYRLQRAIDALRHSQPEEGSLAVLALEHGFFDQAHMNHDVKDLTGLAPGALWRAVTEHATRPNVTRQVADP